ncbi:MAG: helix-turn-helix transcriptional regulator [Gammaproteobacteria bacterium]|jgi:transcriptional regulator with XRE-family HTH domain
MDITTELSDDAVLAELGERLAHRRIQVGLTQVALARQAGVSRSTVERLERGGSVQLTSLIRILRQLRLLHVLDGLVPQSVPGPMELLTRGGRRQRVRQPQSPPPDDDEFKWGEDT